MDTTNNDVAEQVARRAALEIVKFLDAEVSDTEMEQLIALVQSGTTSEAEERCVKCGHGWSFHRADKCRFASFPDQGGALVSCTCEGVTESEGPTGCLDDNDALSQALRKVSPKRLNEILNQELRFPAPSVPAGDAATCQWTQDKSDYRWYKTGCGRETDGFDGAFCTYCGKTIAVSGASLATPPEAAPSSGEVIRDPYANCDAIVCERNQALDQCAELHEKIASIAEHVRTAIVGLVRAEVNSYNIKGFCAPSATDIADLIQRTPLEELMKGGDK